MSYDPLKALRAAGIFEGPLPASLEQALSKLTQEEVDMIISHGSRNPSFSSSQPPAWSSPQVSPLSPTSAVGCACGAWSGSGRASMAE